MEDMNNAKGIASNDRRIELFGAATIFSYPLHPASALCALSFELASHACSDPKLAAAPQTAHLRGVISGKLG